MSTVAVPPASASQLSFVWPLGHVGSVVYVRSTPFGAAAQPNTGFVAPAPEVDQFAAICPAPQWPAPG
jgi:hypothetical protein